MLYPQDRSEALRFQVLFDFKKNSLTVLWVCVCVQIQAKKAQKGEARQQAAAEEKASGQGAGLFSYINNMLGERSGRSGKRPATDSASKYNGHTLFIISRGAEC